MEGRCTTGTRTHPAGGGGRQGRGATAIVLDVAGPVAVVVEESDLLHLAAGDTLVRTRAGLAWARQGL
ncbi:MAG: hypothetical protein WKF83_07095 [Nocardioidaceae bacterium]